MQNVNLSTIKREIKEKPIRLVVYGVEGVGKSSFAANAPNPIFMCAEDGTSHLNVARFPSLSTFEDVLRGIKSLETQPHEFKTLVIDTVDWLEPMIWAHVCAKHGQASIESFPYGKGYVFACEEWRMLALKLQKLEASKLMNVILLAHTTIKKHTDPHIGEFNRFAMKLHATSADVLKEWADAVLFAKYEIFASEKKGKIRGISSGERLLFTEWNAAFDAKNRFDLPEYLPLNWRSFEEAKAQPGKLRASIEEAIGKLPAQRVDAARKRLSDAVSRDDLVKLQDQVNAALLKGLNT